MLQITPLHRITSEIIDALLDQSLFRVEVALMTGSLFKFDVAYGQFDNGHSLLSMMYDKLFPFVAAVALAGYFDVDFDLEADEKLLLREDLISAASAVSLGASSISSPAADYVSFS